MRERFMHVWMIMWFLYLLPVFMPMMLVVTVRMGMDQLFMPVAVTVDFSVKEQHP